jgi:hypothetical protein
MVTFTATTTTDGWELIASSTNGVTTYTIKEPNGSTIFRGSNPTGSIRKDASLTRFNQELFAPDGVENFTGLSINGVRNAYVASNDRVNTLLASLSQMVQTTNTAIKAQQTRTAPVSTTLLNQGSLATPPLALEPVTIPQFDEDGNQLAPVSGTLLNQGSLATPPLALEPVTIPQFDEDGNLTDDDISDLDFESTDEEIDDTGEGEGDEIVVEGKIDWRVKLSLAPGSEYLYNSQYAGILEPLYDQGGVIFPYTPTINVNYVANYEPASIVHSNYKVFQYSNSAVDTVTITCDFTAQDDKEARYLLAVIHFFRSMTKMFYGQDQNPRAGTPPPLCYLRGMGTFQFKDHPLAITSFAYNLPNDVDYISTTGASITGSLTGRDNQSSSLRLPPNVLPGGVAPPPNFASAPSEGPYEYSLTWVPSKIQMSITCVPIISRNDISNEFSLEGYANGDLYADRGFW